MNFLISIALLVSALAFVKAREGKKSPHLRKGIYHGSPRFNQKLRERLIQPRPQKQRARPVGRRTNVTVFVTVPETTVTETATTTLSVLATTTVINDVTSTHDETITNTVWTTQTTYETSTVNEVATNTNQVTVTETSYEQTTITLPPFYETVSNTEFIGTMETFTETIPENMTVTTTDYLTVTNTISESYPVEVTYTDVPVTVTETMQVYETTVLDAETTTFTDVQINYVEVTSTTTIAAI